MPIYEYECRRCHHRFEARQSFQDEPIGVCPECHGAARRVLHPVGVIFKGPGFYTTDNRQHDSREGQESLVKKNGSDTPKDKDTECRAPDAE